MSGTNDYIGRIRGKQQSYTKTVKGSTFAFIADFFGGVGGKIAL